MTCTHQASSIIRHLKLAFISSTQSVGDVSSSDQKKKKKKKKKKNNNGQGGLEY
jgi:hypothetical protein